MPGKNLQGLNADESKQYQVTVGDDGELGNGLGDHIERKPGRVIYRDRYAGLSIDLTQLGLKTRATYAIHIHSEIDGAAQSYVKIIYFPTGNHWKVVEELKAASNSHGYSIDSSGILRDDAGGGRDCVVRIELIADFI